MLAVHLRKQRKYYVMAGNKTQVTNSHGRQLVN